MDQINIDARTELSTSNSLLKYAELGDFVIPEYERLFNKFNKKLVFDKDALNAIAEKHQICTTQMLEDL